MARPGADAQVLARLKIACWREAYPGILPQPILDGLDLGRSTAEWRSALNEGIAWIATEAGFPVGFGHMRGAEVTTLYVRAADHGRGVGREILHHLFDEIGCLGHRMAHLWVLEENPKARRFYERMGGRLAARRCVGFRRYPHITEVRYDFTLG